MLYLCLRLYCFLTAFYCFFVCLIGYFKDLIHFLHDMNTSPRFLISLSIKVNQNYWYLRRRIGTWEGASTSILQVNASFFRNIILGNSVYKNYSIEDDCSGTKYQCAWLAEIFLARVEKSCLFRLAFFLLLYYRRERS